RRRQLGNHRRAENLFAREFGDDPFGCLALLLVVVEDHRAALRSYIRALTALGGRAVQREECLQQVGVSDDGRLVSDTHDLGVTCSAAAHLLVRRVFDMSAGIAGHYLVYAFKLGESRFQTPKASASE